MDITVIVVCFIVGLGIGVISGLAGVGGGAFIIPFLKIGLQTPILTANACSIFVIFFSTLSSAATHIKNKMVNLKYVILFSIPGMIFSVLGTYFSHRIPDLALVIITAIVMIVPTIQTIYSIYKQKKLAVRETAKEFRWGEFHLTLKDWIVCPITGAVAGFLTGIVGLGGGFLIIPVMQAILKREIHETNATSVAYICCVSVIAAISHFIAGDIEFFYCIPLALGCIPSAIISSNIAKKIDGMYLKLSFAIVIILAAGALFISEFV